MEIKKSYKEISNYPRPDTLIFLIVRKIASYFVYKLQRFDFSPNNLTFCSLLSGLCGSFFLIFYNSRILFIIFFIFASIFDNMDGIWARIKNKGSEFGKWFDLRVDMTNEFLYSISIIIFYFYFFQTKGWFIFLLFFIFLKAIYYLTRREGKLGERPKYRIFNPFCPVDKFVIVLPILLIHQYIFVSFLVLYFMLYFYGTIKNIVNAKKELSHQ